ncbi:MAG: hypothetical protein WAN84_05825, partial [Acutalibacteraceae bacterium]
VKQTTTNGIDSTFYIPVPHPIRHNGLAVLASLELKKFSIAPNAPFLYKKRTSDLEVLIF